MRGVRIPGLLKLLAAGLAGFAVVCVASLSSAPVLASGGDAAGACPNFITSNEANYIRTFICPNPNDNPVTRNSWDGYRVNIFASSGGADVTGSQDSNSPKTFVPGTTLRFQLNYKTHLSAAGTVHAFINWSSSGSGQQWTDVTGSYSGDPVGSFSGTQDCPSYFYGPDAPTTGPYTSQTNAQAAGAHPGDRLGAPGDTTPNWDYVQTHNISGWMSCLGNGISAIWDNTGSGANNSYTYTANLKTDPDYRGSATIHARGYVSDGVVSGAAGRADLAARSQDTYYATNTKQIKVTVNGPNNLPAPRLVLSAHCGGQQSLSNGNVILMGEQGDPTGSVHYYYHDIPQGVPYCVSIPTSATIGTKAYNLVSQNPAPTGVDGTFSYQVAGVNCLNNDASSTFAGYLESRCNENGDNHSMFFDTGTDNVSFSYARQAGSGNVTGTIYDSQFTGQKIIGETVGIGVDKGSCQFAAPTGLDASTDPDTTDGSGKFAFNLATGIHYCVFPNPDYIGDPSGFHYRYPKDSIWGGAIIGGQVAGLDCHSFDPGSDLGAQCTGWSTTEVDNSHIAAEHEVTHTDPTDDQACAGSSPGATAGSFSGAGPDSVVVENYEPTTQTHTGSYGVNAKCVHTEAAVTSAAQGPCLNGGGDKPYGSNYAGNDYRRCNQFNNGDYYDNGTKNTYDGLCSGQADEGYDPGGNYPADERCHQYLGDERQTASGVSGKCSGGSDENYYYANNTSNYMQSPYPPSNSISGDYHGDANGGPIADRRCNQWNAGTSTNPDWKHSTFELPYRHTVFQGDDTHHSVYGLVKIVYRKDFQVYPFDRAQDTGMDFSMDGYTTISGRVYNATTGTSYSNDHIYTGSAKTFNMQPNTTGYGPANGSESVGNVYADGSGNFTFEILRQQSYVVRANYASNYHGGYTYDPYTGVALNCAQTNGAYDILGGCSYESQAAYVSQAPGYDLVYHNPVLSTTKSVSPSNGSNVKPGDTLTYTVTTTNSGDTASSFTQQDLIPQNIDPASVNVTSTSGTSASVDRSNGSPNVSMSGTLSAGGTWTVTWTGRVRNANEVGSFPVDYRYCANSNWSYRGDTTTHTDDYYDPNGTRQGSSCEDYSGGMQAVANFARSSYTGTAGGFSGWGKNTDNSGDGRGGSASGVVINPIPGTISCIEKLVSPENSDPTQGSSVTPCGTTYANRYIYSTTEFNTGTFSLNIKPDRTLGPVDAYIIDQTNNNTVNLGGIPMDAALSNHTVTTGSPGNAPFRGYTDSGNVLTWHNYNWAASDPNTYSFNVTYTDQGAGHTFNNTAKVCWPQYWLNGHPVTCQTSNTLKFLQTSVDYPYLASTNGDVHAGGGVSNSLGTCPGVLNQSAQNPSANGQAQASYMVTATGAVGNFLGSAAGAANKSYGIICRPDLVNSANNYISRGYGSANQPSGSAVTNDNGFDGKVVSVTPSAGTSYTLNTSTLNVTKRWTLYVHGDLYIGANIIKNTATGNIPSLGIIATGNIYIDPAVTQIDAYLFSSNKINTCSKAGGYPTLNNGFSDGTNGVTTCSNKLTINGLMMANIFRLNRTYHSVAKDSAEQVNFSQLLFTATPPAFSNLGKTYLPPTYLGETSPRF